MAGGGTLVSSAESAFFALGRGQNGGFECRIRIGCRVLSALQTLYNLQRKTGDFADLFNRVSQILHSLGQTRLLLGSSLLLLFHPGYELVSVVAFQNWRRSNRFLLGIYNPVPVGV